MDGLFLDIDLFKWLLVGGFVFVVLILIVEYLFT